MVRAERPRADEDRPSVTARVADATLLSEIEFLALKAFADGTRLVNERLAGLGLRARSYSVLAIACSASPLSQRELSTLLELDPSQIVPLVDGLVEQGLVARMTNDRDRRYRIVRALPAGEALFRRAHRVALEAEADALAVLSEGERDTLRALLRKIVLQPEAQG